MVAADGALPIVVDGKIIGAIGVSGLTGAEDGQIAQAGAAALK
jgi:glc operon protein GlcG